MIKSIRTKKTLYVSLFLIIFFQIFIHNAFDNWRDKYRRMHVPANVYPGGDSRNIQKAAFCHSKYGFDYYDDNECFNNNSLLTNFYSEKETTPKYNYPPVVARIYEFFNDYSEKAFREFWVINMLLLISAISILSYKINYCLLPLMIFSPVTLLAIERGNIDAIAFSIVFLSLLLTSSISLRIIFIAIATSIKLFPVVGYLALYKKNVYAFKSMIVAFMLASPLLIYSILPSQEYFKLTSYGFSVAFGLFSLKNAPFFRHHLLLADVVIATYLFLVAVLVFHIDQKVKLINPLLANIQQQKEKHLDMLLMSLTIYISVFLISTSWGYRFIFLMPTFLILSTFKDKISKTAFWLTGITMWVPFIKKGWYLFNVLNYILFPLLVIIFINSYKKILGKHVI